MPREAVRFVHDAKSDRDKGELFAACRAGTVAVLIGSTEKMGVGTNVQFRAIALHHLDCPWRPADVAQREGRILRQGNHNTEVQILRYVTERSFDGYMWQTVERKARFIAQVMRGRLDVREIEDIGDAALSYNEVKALATGNPLLMEKAEADAELTRLERAERAHHRNQEALQHKVAQADQRIAALTALIGDIDIAIARRTDTRGDAFTMTMDGITYTKRADASRHLQQLVAQLEANPPQIQPPAARGTPRRTRRLPGDRHRRTRPGLHERHPGPRRRPRHRRPHDPRRGPRRRPRQADHPPGEPPQRPRIPQLTLPRPRSTSSPAEAAHARDDIARPFPQAAQLTAARDRVARLEEKLRETAMPSRRNNDDWLVAAVFARRGGHGKNSRCCLRRIRSPGRSAPIRRPGLASRLSGGQPACQGWTGNGAGSVYTENPRTSRRPPSELSGLSSRKCPRTALLRSILLAAERC